MSTKQKAKQVWEMTPGELAEITAKFDEEFVVEKSRPLSPSMKAKWEKAKRKPGRPRVGKGAKTISVSIEQTLLEKADWLADKLGISRAQLITAGLIGLMTGAVAVTTGKKKRS